MDGDDDVSSTTAEPSGLAAAWAACRWKRRGGAADIEGLASYRRRGRGTPRSGPPAGGTHYKTPTSLPLYFRALGIAHKDQWTLFCNH